MTTATRTSRFSKLAMPADKAMTGVALNFPFTTTIWANASGRAADVIGSGGSEETAQPGLGSVSSRVENPWGSWNATDAMSSARSASPARSRDERQELQSSNAPSYFDAPNCDTIGSTHRYQCDLDDGPGGLNRASFASNYSSDTPPEPGFPSMEMGFGPISRGQTFTPSAQVPDALDAYNFGGRHTPGSFSSAQRVQMGEFPVNSRAYSNERQIQDGTDLAGHLARSLKIAGMSSAAGPADSLTSPPFPTSLSASQQPWADGYGGTSAKLSGDRVPSSSLAPPGEGWSRPSSRDARAGLDSDRHSQQSQQSLSPVFYPSANPYMQYAHIPPPFDDYNVTQLRHHMQVAANNHGPSFFNQPAPPPTRPVRDQDPMRGMRSSLLEGFRQIKGTKSPRRYDLKDIYNHVVEFSGDQLGSRFIQSKLEEANSDEKDHVFREINANAIQLMKDVFGNYVIQKIFEHGNQLQKKILAGHMRGKMADLSVQMYACRVVQTALEHILCEQAAELVSELEEDILKVIRDQNGNHVVQKIIVVVPREHWGFIVDAMRGQASQFSSHLYGCRVVQRLLEKGSEQDKADLLAELHQATPALISDQYGNYVAQHIIQHGKPEDKSRIIRQVTNNIISLSKHKFASNVVEKCIVHGSPAERSSILDLLLKPGADGNSPLSSMMKDQYGNYVIQTLVGQLDGEEKIAFIREMQPHFVAARKGGGSRQLTALEKMVQPSALQVNVKSAAPTPSLTDGPNSPQSSSAPSTTASAVGEAAGEAVGEGPGERELLEKVKVAMPAPPAVRVV